MKYCSWRWRRVRRHEWYCYLFDCKTPLRSIHRMLIQVSRKSGLKRQAMSLGSPISKTKTTIINKNYYALSYSSLCVNNKHNNNTLILAADAKYIYTQKYTTSKIRTGRQQHALRKWLNAPKSINSKIVAVKELMLLFYV